MTFFCPECEAPAKRGFRIANMILFRCRFCNFRWTEFLMQPSLEGGDPVPFDDPRSEAELQAEAERPGAYVDGPSKE